MERRSVEETSSRSSLFLFSHYYERISPSDSHRIGWTRSDRSWSVHLLPWRRNILSSVPFFIDQFTSSVFLGIRSYPSRHRWMEPFHRSLSFIRVKGCNWERRFLPLRSSWSKLIFLLLFIKHSSDWKNFPEDSLLIQVNCSKFFHNCDGSIWIEFYRDLKKKNNPMPKGFHLSPIPHFALMVSWGKWRTNISLSDPIEQQEDRKHRRISHLNQGD